MPKIYKWSSFSLAELRKVAKAYKDHTKVPAPSKMTKKDLIVLLDKHLLLDKDTAEIKVRETMESSLGEVERMPKKMKMTKVPSAPALPPMAEDKTYKKRIGKSKVPPPKMLDEEQMKSASSDAMDMAKLAMELLQQSIMNSEDEKMEDMSKAELRKKLKEIDPGLKDSVISKWDMKTLEKEYNKRLKKKDEKEKMALYHLEETVKVMEEIKPAEKPKEMSLTDRIQDLPFDLQDLIFKKLPQQQQKDLKEGTEQEQGRRKLVNWLKTNKIKATKKWVDDYIGLDDNYYEYERDIIDNIQDYDDRFRGWEDWSEAKSERMMELSFKIAGKIATNFVLEKVKLYKERKLTDIQIVNQLTDDLGGKPSKEYGETKAEEKARQTVSQKLSPREQKEKDDEDERENKRQEENRKKREEQDRKTESEDKEKKQFVLDTTAVFRKVYFMVLQLKDREDAVSKYKEIEKYTNEILQRLEKEDKFNSRVLPYDEKKAREALLDKIKSMINIVYLSYAKKTTGIEASKKLEEQYKKRLENISPGLNF